jgi:conjugative relaxase-like TrwC/TraI family protein
MLNVCNISAGQASGYYRKDNYYLKSGTGEWLGELKDRFKLPDQLNADDFDRILKQHEKFRTYEIKCFVSKDIAELVKDNRQFHDLHGQIVDKIVKQMQQDIRQQCGKDIKFKADIEIKYESGGGLTVISKSHNVSPRYWHDFYKVLQDEKYKTMYGREMVAGLKGMGIQADEKNFNLQSFEVTGRVGYDVTLSVPKSVSIAMTVNGEYQEALKRAHDRAVKDTLAFIQDNYIEYRCGRQAERKQSDKILIAKVDHFLSRRLDPQLHSHCIIFNSCEGEDGKLRSIENDLIYARQRLLDVHFYKVQLAHHVRQEGFEIDIKDKANGVWELKGVKGEGIDFFSKGREEIIDFIRKNGLDIGNPRQREMANLLTRKSLGKVDFEALQEVWRIGREQLGISEHTFVRTDPHQLTQPSLKDFYNRVDAKFFELVDHFKKEDYLFFSAPAALKEGVSMRDIEKHLNANIQNKQFVPIYYAGDKYYMSQDNYRIEREIFQRVSEGIEKSPHFIDPHKYRDYLYNTGMTGEQIAAVEHIVSSRDVFSAVNGVAGSGKTSSVLKEANHILKQEGYEIKGLSFTGKASLGIYQDAGIESSTIHSFLNRLERLAGNRTKVPPEQIQNDWNFRGLQKSGKKELWLVDEANMINNKLMHYLQEAALRRGVKMVFTGDYRQLQPIGAGNSYSRMIVEYKINYVDLTESLRIRNTPQHIREGITEASRGNIERSVNKLDRCIFEIGDRESRIDTIARKFSSLSKEERDLSVIITGTNRDRVSINERVRGYLKDKGELADGLVYELRSQNKDRPKFEREISLDDKVIFLKNDKKVGVTNGQMGRVTAIAPGEITIRSRDKLLKIDLNQYNYLDHYYASTTWKSEGSTFKNVLVNIDTRQRLINSREDYYVKISRTRDDLIIYTNDRKNLVEAVIKSGFVSEQGEAVRRENRLNRLPPEIRRDVKSGQHHYKEWLQYSRSSLDQRKSPHQGADDTAAGPTAYAYNFRSLAKKSLHQSARFFDRSLKQYEKHLNRRFSDMSLKSELIGNFKRDFIPGDLMARDIPHHDPDKIRMGRTVDFDKINNKDFTHKHRANPFSFAKDDLNVTNERGFHMGKG